MTKSITTNSIFLTKSFLCSFCFFSAFRLTVPSYYLLFCLFFGNSVLNLINSLRSSVHISKSVRKYLISTLRINAKTLAKKVKHVIYPHNLYRIGIIISRVKFFVNISQLVSRVCYGLVYFCMLPF